MSHVFALDTGVILETVTCCTCCMVFAMPQEVKKRRIDDKQTFYCPVGHTQSFRGVDLDKIRADLQSARALAEERAQALERSAQALERSARTVARLKKRIAQARGT